MHALLEHDLVDELHLLVYPITLGKGKHVLAGRAQYSASRSTHDGSPAQERSRVDPDAS